MQTGETHTSSAYRIREHFPILAARINQNPLIYLDNAATTQKPFQVLDAVRAYNETTHANVHRGVHELSRKATAAIEEVRSKVATYLSVTEREVIFTSGTTAAINQIASSLPDSFFSPGKTILISTLEHHSNILPWMFRARRSGCEVVSVPLNQNGFPDEVAFLELLSRKQVSIVALTHLSNTLGITLDLKRLVALAHRHGALVLVDGAQAVGHMQPSPLEYDADFYVFGAHKMFGPTGTGVLWGKEEHLKHLMPAFTGGGIIKSVSFSEVEYAELPQYLEPGTPNMEGIVGLGAAIGFIQKTGWNDMHSHEKKLTELLRSVLLDLDEIDLYGSTEKEVPLFSMNIRGVHPYDTGTLLNEMGIAVRTGHHCTQPLMNFLGVPGTVRISASIYNTEEELVFLGNALKKCIKLLR